MILKKPIAKLSAQETRIGIETAKKSIKKPTKSTVEHNKFVDKQIALMKSLKRGMNVKEKGLMDKMIAAAEKQKK